MADKKTEVVVRAPAFVYALKTPIEAHGEKLTELRFRAPTAKDILEIGNPVIFDPVSDPPIMTHDMHKMQAMLSRLAEVPPSSILELGPRDLVSCAWGVTPFFVPEAGSI
jgi:hypothetical protein